jgi:hypothetical protein
MLAFTHRSICRTGKECGRKEENLIVRKFIYQIMAPVELPVGVSLVLPSR